MGQKVNPLGFRTGPNLVKEWNSILYADKRSYSKALIQDLQIRKLIKDNCFHAQISKIAILCPNKKVLINIYVKKTGVVINKIQLLKQKIVSISNCENVYINVHEVKKVNTDANIIAQNIAMQLEKRVSFRRAMKTSISSCLRSGARGIKISCSGRLGGAEIARTEWYREGRVPLHTIRADIDYATIEAHTAYGVIGIKVWVYNGDHVDNKKI